MTKGKKGLLPGVYIVKKADGDISYRASLTRRGKHISLGSYATEEAAHLAYIEGSDILADEGITLNLWNEDRALTFARTVSLINLRITGLYFAAPIMLGKRDFLYYFGPDDAYRFDIDDLFYYSSHRIMRRGNRLFVADYGSQLSVLSRFGIRSFAVAGRDYLFRNGDDRDLRYENIEIINRYRGVLREGPAARPVYKTVILVGRSRFVVGRYGSESEAAIAYNKAADTLSRRGVRRKYELNYLDDVGPRDYAEIYARVSISDKLSTLTFGGE